MSSGANWNNGDMKNKGPANTCWATCPITGGLPPGLVSTWEEGASTVIPTKSVPRMTAIQVSVIAALRVSGFLKAGTPLEMASTPVIAEQPAAKDLSSRKSESDSVAATYWKCPMSG